MAALQTRRGLYLLGLFSFFFLFLSTVHSTTTSWPGLQYDAQFTGHYPGNALGHARPQNFILYANPDDASPGVGHFTVSSNSSGQYIYSAENYINVYQITGTTMNVTATLPMQEHHQFDNAQYLTTLQPFGGCTNRLAATLYIAYNATDEDQTGVYLYYWCLDGGDQNTEFSTPTPYNFTTAPVAQVASDNSYELIAAGALGNLILIFTPPTGFPTLDIVPVDAVAIAIDPQMNVYITSKTSLSAYSTNGEQTSATLIYNVPIPENLCDNFMGSCFLNLDTGKGVIYLYGIGNQMLYAYQMSNGNLMTNISLGSFPVNYGALSNNTNAGYLIIPTRTNIVAVNVASNPFLLTWTYPSGGNIFSNIITDNLPYAYAVDQRGNFVALNINNKGFVEWLTQVQRTSSSNGFVSLSLGPGGSLVPSFDNLIWVMQPSTPVVPQYIYPYYAMNVLNGFKKTFQLNGNPEEDPLFDYVNCSVQTPSGLTLASKGNLNNAILCYIPEPIDVATLEAYYSFTYTDGTPLVETYQLPSFQGVGITGINPSAIAAGTTGTITVLGTGFNVCNTFGGCYCGFGYVEITNINTENVTTATYINNTALSCPTVATSNPIVQSTNPLPFTLFFPSDPNLNTGYPSATTNAGITLSYFTRIIPTISPLVSPTIPNTANTANTANTPNTPNSPSHPKKKHVAAIVVPIVVVILVIVVVVAGFLYYRMKVKQQEYSPITSDRRSYTAF